MKKNKLQLLFQNHGHFILAFLLILWAFHRWFGSGIISWGDWWPESLDSYIGAIRPDLWSGTKQLGSSLLNEFSAAVWLPSFSFAGLLTKYFGLSYSGIEKIIWFWPYVFIAPFSYYFFWRSFFPDKKAGLFAGLLFFTINTYSMLLTMGGHINLSIVYALAPAVLALVKRFSEKPNIRSGIILGLIVTLAISYEIRGVILLAGMILLYLLLFCRQIGLKNIFLTLICFFGIPLLLNLWWIIPFLLQKQAELLPATYDQAKWVKESSYADFSHAITLFHPQWFDNVLGKINPIPFIFYLIPLILIPTVIWAKKDARIKFFLLLAILAIFLIKGANPPFGGIYIFLFKYFPTFQAFRDPSKFNFYLGFCYSVLFAFTVAEISEKKTRLAKTGLVIFSILPLIWLWPVYNQKIGGTFKLISQPTKNYQQFEQEIKKDKSFVRTLWLPKKQRFAYFSETHPIVSTDEAINNSIAFIKGKTNRTIDAILNPLASYILPDMGIGYVVIPDDDTKDIYKDYLPKYYYQELANQQNWLTKDQNFNLAVYRVKNPEDIIYTRDSWIFVNKLNSDILANYLLAQKQKQAIIFAEPTDKLMSDLKLTSGQSYLFSKKYPFKRNFTKVNLKENQAYSSDLEILPLTVTNQQPFNLFIPTEIAADIKSLKIDNIDLNLPTASHWSKKYQVTRIPAIKKGLHLVTIKRGYGPNIFQQNVWTTKEEYPLPILKKECRNLEAAGSSVFSREAGILKLRSFDLEGTCLAKRVELPSKERNFLFSFKFQKKFGTPVIIILEESNGTIHQLALPAYFDSPKYSQEWLNWQKKIFLSPESQSATIYFTYQNDQSINEAWFKDIEFRADNLENLQDKNILWGNLLEIPVESRSEVAKIERDSNSSLEVEIKNASHPHLVILNNQFNPDWQGRLVSGGRSLLNIKTNGFANGFFSQEVGDYKLKIDFQLNQYLLLGCLLSVISFIGVIITLLGSIIKRKKLNDD